MQALTVEPGRADSARVETVPDPDPEQGAVLVRTLAVGICGTDSDIVEGLYGAPPPGRPRLILGHESLGRVAEAPPGAGLAPGDLVVGIVRRPDPAPCRYCAVGEWDMCVNGDYTEHGIKALDGFCAELFRTDPDFALRIDPSLGVAAVLVEPASVVAKAWEHVDRIGGRSPAWAPRVALVTGAGPVGLLAALAAVQRGLRVHVLDRVADGSKPRLVRALGATYHEGKLPWDLAPEVVIECTGAPPVIVDAVTRTAASGITCLAGISSGQHRVAIDVATLNRDMVLENDVVFGSVNANRRHYEAAAAMLGRADPDWLAGVITRRLPLSRWREALDRPPDDIKTIIDFTL